MKCDFCGGETKPKPVTRQHWLNGKLYIVENVSAQVCTDCGERYFHAVTLDAIDKFLSKKHEVKARLNVELVQFEQPVYGIQQTAFA
jgi:YgiT-type zinc finger domain-containing protein